MSFLNWFKKKSRNTEGEGKPSGADESSSEPSTSTLTASGNAGQETAADAPFIEQQSASPPVMPLSATDTPKQPASVTAGPSATPHFFVPIGAFYEKLPPHLVAPERPDLTRLIEIAEEDVVIEQESQEATVPLSILSLSCPDIFVRPVAGSDEIQITFFVNRQLSTAVAEPPDQPAAQPLENPIQARESGNAEVPAGISAEGAPASASSSAGFEFTGPAENAEREIRLRLEPILSNFPLGLEQPSIRALSETRAEIVLPLDVIRSQLPKGRVVISAAMFCGALPNDLKPYFDAIEPTAEIPIPLREIFVHLPPEVIKLREDQEIDYPESSIQTPFSKQKEEDAKRLGRDAPTPPGSGPMPDKAGDACTR